MVQSFKQINKLIFIEVLLIDELLSFSRYKEKIIKNTHNMVANIQISSTKQVLRD